MDVRCGTCSLNIDTDKELYTICEGKCAKRFHGKCARVSKDDLRALSNNIIWICDHCMAHFRRVRDMDMEPVVKMPTTIEIELNELKSQAAGIIAAIDKITHRAEVPEKVPTLLHRHSTPVTSPKTMEATSICSANKIGDESFSLFLTNIDSCVTEEDISQMVSSSLCAPEEECAVVTKLVPKWKNCVDLDFISFKVVLNHKWKRSAMTATTWPKGVRFREFVNQREDTWRPAVWMQNTA